MAGRWCFALLAGATLIASAACDSDSNREATTGRAEDTVTVGSFDFAESRLLAEIYSQALEAHGYRVNRAFDLGPREFVIPALAAGLIDFVPEYAGTALQFVSLGASAPKTTIGATHDALASAVRTRELVVLESAPAQNVNAFVVTRETARRYALQDLSDLASVAPRLILGGPPECPTRPFCLKGLEDTYDLAFKEFVPLDAGGPLTRTALDKGVIDVAVLFSTDPAINDLVELADDRRLQPAESVTPLVRSSVVARWGAPLVELVDSVSRRLTTDLLRALNQAVAADPPKLASVAAHWLKSEGIM